MGAELYVVPPRSLDWGDFDCGDTTINDKLNREMQRATLGLQVLYGVRDQGRLLSVLTLRAGHLQADSRTLYQLGRGHIEVPTLHVEVLATRTAAQGQGHARRLTEHALETGLRLKTQVGLLCVSLEATASSQEFYRRLGFDQDVAAWPDGTRAMWFVL